MSDVPSLTITHSEILRGGNRVVQAGAVAVPLGATVGLVGLNGAGKSTLMMAIAGALTGGSASVTIASPTGPVQAVGYVPQQPRFPEWLTVGETAQVFGVPPTALIDAFPEFHLEPLLEQRTAALSGGQRQLFAVALMLLQRVDLVVLDEPLSALDIQRRRQLLERLRGRVAGQVSVVRFISSQVAADIADVCDWLVVLRDGRYVFQGARESLGCMAGESPESPGGTGKGTAFEEKILDLLTG
jgi:ABC-2 type transport system ATP-binding protein